MVMGALSIPATLTVSDASSSARRFFGEGAYDNFGWRVRLADLNGDGLLDPVMAAPYADPLGCVDCGEIYAIHWSNSLPEMMSMSDVTVPMTRFIGSGDSPAYGETMTSGRINADLAEDLLIKHEADNLIPGDRRSVVVAYGSASLPDTVFLDSDSTLTRILAEQPGDYLGLGLVVSDLDGDGLGEICIGAPWTDALGRYSAGKVHIFYGCPTVSHVTPGVPVVSRLHIYPNPFNPETTVEFSLATSVDVQLTIFDVRGAVVRSLTRGRFAEGTHIVSWDGRDDRDRPVASGVYFCRLVVGSFTDTKKMTVLK
jgi:FlgD Ig-like domain/FG-GAP repeat